MKQRPDIFFLGGVNKLLPTKHIKSSSVLSVSGAWHRALTIAMPESVGSAVCLICVSSDYKHRQPTSCLFLLSQSYNTHYLVQIGKRPKVTTGVHDLDAVRVIQKNHILYFDIQHSVPAAGGNNAYVDIFPLNNIISNITMVNFTDVTDEDPGNNYTQLTPITAE